MLKNVPSLQRLVDQLRRIPFLASRNLYRVAAYFLEVNDQEVDQLCAVLREVRANVRRCAVCYSWAEKDSLCIVCAAPQRDKTTICVVETWHDLCAIERAGVFRGVYHVLGGSLCPLEGIGPNDLFIAPLLARVQNDVREVIFATNPTPEGEATASYIAAKITSSDITISRIASGLSTGSTLEYTDSVTIHKAISGRRQF
jgi:recombination protein RecR